MEREGYVTREDVFLSWPRKNLSVLTFIFIRDAKSSITMDGDTCMPINFPRCARVHFVYCYLSQTRKHGIPSAPPGT